MSGITVRSFDMMVDATLDRIIAANVGFTDKSKGSVLRTLVEAIITELDLQYYQLTNLYKAYQIDESFGVDLEHLISILNVIRNQATKATTSITYARSTPATNDIQIPSGSIISTKPDSLNNTIEFETTADAVLVTGNSSVNVAARALIAGSINISANQVNVMLEPIIGIESVYNASEIDSGTDTETDDSLRTRAKNKLSELGKGTNDALVNAISGLSFVLDALMFDMNRGNGTSDISVVCTTMPPTQTMQDQINAIISLTKSSGVDVQAIYPTIVPVNITLTTTGNGDIAGNAILEYFNTLGTNDTFIVSQCQSRIVSAYNSGDIDVTISSPSSNVTPGSFEILRAGTITINGVVWNG